ncbi:MAG: cytochrome c5 family protein [Proteobacteria bacterium]|nr:cytochrome c5 family protein [Pseudomonadota bacterium]
MSQSAAHDEHSSFIQTPKQLLVVLLLAFLVPIIGIVMLVQLILGETNPNPAALEPAAVAARIQPVGRVEVVDANAPKVVKSGEDVVKAVCGACHTTGAANAPKIGDKAGWAARLGQGLDGLTKSAIKGKNAMPPRGGVPDLSDYEIARAIVFMANQSGASFKEPAEPKAAPAAAPADAKKDAKK